MVARGGEEEAGVFDGVVEDEGGDAEAEERVDEVDAGEAHNDGADEDRDPGEAIFEHMKVDGALVERVAVASDEGGEEVEEDAEEGKDDHTIVVDFGGVEDARDGFVDEDARGGEEDDGGKDGAKAGIAFVAVVVTVVEILK